MSREPHYTPEELFVKFTEAGRVGQRQRPIDKKRLQEFLFLMSFLYYLATIGTVAGDSDNFFYFLNRINIPGQAVSGRYVIVQMDNGEGVPLSLKEVRSYGIKGETPRKEGSFNFLEIGWYRFNRRKRL